ncbi:unnamed protein product [Urochloa decumbens]|uniref:BTB domain-containing protein n=1 Tax=Urochloa decumbens TaxID=240449 RepID=A0ABC9BPS9_9POAL
MLQYEYQVPIVSQLYSPLYTCSTPWFIMWDSCFTRIKLDYWETKHLRVGDATTTCDLAAAGHLWRINCYPRGYYEEGHAKYLSLFLELRSPPPQPGGVTAIFDAFVIDLDGEPSSNYSNRTIKSFPPAAAGDPPAWAGWGEFVKRRILEDFYVTDDGHVTIVCGVIVVGAGGAAGDDDAIPVPPSRMGSEIAALLATDGGGAPAGADVSFTVGGETVAAAHRVVLAARSPVFRAELFGPMSDATSPSIALHDVDPAAFRLMVRYIYTDALPGDAELAPGGADPAETVKNLLAVADRYAIERLKLMCAQRLWEKVTPETFASTLAFAETYSCPELKSKCVGFFAVDRNLKQVIFTDGFLWLMQEFPSLVAELKASVGM